MYSLYFQPHAVLPDLSLKCSQIMLTMLIKSAINLVSSVFDASAKSVLILVLQKL